MDSNYNLSLALRPSALLIKFSLGIHVLALTAVFFSGAQPWLILLLSIVLVAHGYWSYYRLRHPFAQRLTIHGDSVWVTEKGQISAVHFTGTQFISTWLVILRLQKIAGRRSFYLTLLRDNCDKEQRRRLRVFLQCR